MKFIKHCAFFIAIITMNCGSLFSHKNVPAPIAMIDSAADLVKVLHSKKSSMVMLYMKNCPHCDTIKGKPDMLEHSFLQDLANTHRSVNVYLANGPELQAHLIIQQESNIKIPGYPTFLFIKNGKVVEHVIGGNKNLLKLKCKALA